MQKSQYYLLSARLLVPRTNRVQSVQSDVASPSAPGVPGRVQRWWYSKTKSDEGRANLVGRADVDDSCHDEAVRATPPQCVWRRSPSKANTPEKRCRAQVSQCAEPAWSGVGRGQALVLSCVVVSCLGCLASPRLVQLVQDPRLQKAQTWSLVETAGSSLIPPALSALSACGLFACLPNGPPNWLAGWLAGALLVPTVRWQEGAKVWFQCSHLPPTRP